MFDIFSILGQCYFFAAYISSGCSFPEPLNAQQEAEALEKMARGDEEARELLIRHNLRLVAHIAKKYTGAGFDQDDLISIGTIGLIKGISTYSPSKGSALSTYAAKCIQNEVLMAIRSAKKHKAEVSICLPIGKDKEGNEITLVDVISAPQEEIADTVEQRLQTGRLIPMMKRCLTQREKTVLGLRYGLCGRDPMPQREVAQILGISRSYVSRIEKKALGKMQKEFEKPKEKAELPKR